MASIILNSSSCAVALTVGATQAVHVHTSTVNLNAGVSTLACANASISNTTTTIVSGPASGQTTVKKMSFFNAGAAAVTITLKHTDGSTPVELYPAISLGVGWCLEYDEAAGFQLIDTSGNIQTGIGPGRFIGRQDVLQGTTTVTASAGVNKWRIRAVGAGGQGGGAATTTGFDGSGGGAGAYAEWVVAVTAGTVYNCVVGLGGSTGTTGANGQAGTNTTLTVGGTTLTVPGGSGGLVGTSAAVPVLGGAGGVVSTNGTMNSAGEPGNQSYGSVAADNGSGAGGCTPFGAGGQGQANSSNATGLSAAALGFGGGGGGGTSTGTARAGGAGANGLITIDELS